jgi:hypothetical protein
MQAPIDFQEIYCETNIIGGGPNAVFHNFLESLTTTWPRSQLVRRKWPLLQGGKFMYVKGTRKHDQSDCVKEYC